MWVEVNLLRDMRCLLNQSAKRLNADLYEFDVDSSILEHIRADDWSDNPLLECSCPISAKPVRKRISNVQVVAWKECK